MTRLLRRRSLAIVGALVLLVVLLIPLTSLDAVQSATQSGYKWGFSTDIEMDLAPKGLKAEGGPPSLGSRLSRRPVVAGNAQ